MDKRKRNKKKRSRKKPFVAAHQFIEGKTSYIGEYRLWQTAKIVKGLLGVFEIPFNEFVTQTTEEHLALVGHAGLTVITYDPDEEGYYRPNPDADVAGYTCGVRTPYGKVKSIIFMRREVHLRQEIPDQDTADEIRAFGKLGILMHEMGHAEDIDKSINYDHQTPSFDGVAGEVYAHAFALKHAQRLGYRHLLFSYCRSLEDDLRSENDVYREAAKRVRDLFDIPAIMKATGFH